MVKDNGLNCFSASMKANIIVVVYSSSVVVVYTDAIVGFSTISQFRQSKILFLTYFSFVSLFILVFSIFIFSLTLV